MHHRRRSPLPLIVALALFAPAAAAQQPATVAGTVSSETGEPLAAVSVLLEGTNIGTVTGADGSYSFTVAAPPTGPTTLTARRVGYRPQSVTISLAPGVRATQDFTLVLNPLRLGEVVITGAGTTTEAEKLGTVRSNVSAEAITRSAEVNLVNALAAKAPNVTVLSSSGEPGASSYIQVRGLTSIASGTGQPLIVVDGTPVDNSTVDMPFSGLNGGTVAMNRGLDINPADIENVEILKGAAAGAIYGARAGQGVILITTKKGSGGETRYTLHSTMSVDEVSNLPALQTEYGVGTGGVTPACYATPTPGCALGFAAAGSWGPRLSAGAERWDHTAEPFRTGLTWDNTLSASGGNERTTYYLSLGALDQRGVIIGPNNELDRYSIRFSGSHRVFDNLRVGATASYTSTQGAFTQSRNNVSGLLLGAWRTPINFNNYPYLDPQTGQHRSYRFPYPTAGTERVSRRYDNPLFIAYEEPATADVDRTFGNVTLDYDPLDWLQVRWTLGADFSNDDRMEVLPLSASSGATPGEGQVITASIANRLIDHNLIATARYSVSPVWSGSIAIGQNLSESHLDIFAQQGNVLVAPRPFTLQNTSTQGAPVDSFVTVRIESYFGQATADLWDQLYLTGALRYDGASTFGTANQRAWFPKGSVAWAFLRDPAFDGWLTAGKVRAAYGESGTQPNAYQTITVYSGNNILEGGWGPVLGTAQNGVRGLYTSIFLGNPNLGPERVTELEAGFDLGLYDDRADFSLTHYRQKTNDAILPFPLQAAGGHTTQLRNLGELENIGWELVLNARPIRGPDLNWDIGVQWSRNRNQVLSLSGANQVVLNAPFGLGSFPQAIVQEGQPMGVWLSDDFVRCGRGVVLDDAGTPLDIDNTAGHCQGAPAGALYIAADGYPIKDQTGQYLIADPNPDWTGSVRTSVTWRRVTVGGLVDVRQGGDVWNGTRTALNHFGRTAETAKYREGTHVFGESYLPHESVAGPGAGTAVAVGEGWFSGLGGVFNGPASFAFEDGSFVKLRELSVQYSWTGPRVQQFGFNAVDFRIAGRNLKTWTDYSGVDPETSVQSAGTSVVRGVDYFNNPQTRSYVFSVTLQR